ncbi:hypothetical protein IAQ61_005616 [Plenodomus lingam]|uniref:uncharacterized protein n=1 Tax=Leptosphaeria maculans TaxID=5022 RepID=UPI003318EF1C|nr:hypothetical protein IAQ61_005616 [Plenodomus lingam]
MRSDALLALLDESTKRAIFERSVKNLNFTASLDLDALRTAVALAPTVESSQSDHAVLWDGLLHWIDCVQRSPDENTHGRLYEIADICLGNGFVIASRFHDRLFSALKTVLADLSIKTSSRASAGHFSDPSEAASPSNLAAAYLRFLRCSFWLPSDRHHLINAECISIISGFIGLELEDIALDTLSALLSLLQNSEQIAIASTLNNLQLPSTSSSIVAANVLAGVLLSHKRHDQDSLWTQIEHVSPSTWQTYSSKIMKVWFQWISQARMAGTELHCLRNAVYWQIVSNKLSRGSAEEQKYCLGIIYQSLLLAKQDIVTKTMVYRVGLAYQTAYEQYTTLYRTIVLNRYPNQVEACLPELTALLGPGSKITMDMTASLLSAALDSRVQVGVRKIIGHWYMNHASETDKVTITDRNFFTGSFLPWATEGSLFVSSLRSTRSETVCSHGAALTDVVARLVATEGARTGIEDASSLQYGATVIADVICFINNARGRIFQPAILYLLEGLLKGLQKRAAGSTLNALQLSLSSADLVGILTLARLPGLPEISTDLLTLYCRDICALIRPDFGSMGLSGSAQLLERVRKLCDPADGKQLPLVNSSSGENVSCSLQSFVAELKRSRHRSIQDDRFGLSCNIVTGILDQIEVSSIDSQQLYDILQAFWEEAERCEFGRHVAIHLPSVLFHPSCVAICVQQHSVPTGDPGGCLEGLLSRALLHLQHLSKGRSYILSVLGVSIRKAVFCNPPIANCLPLEKYILEYLNDPPTSKPEFLFEVAAAEKLERLVSHKTYISYYGQREWHAYAAFVDMLQRWPEEQLGIAKNIFAELVKPWREQKIPAPINSPWKDTLQLQAMLILSDYCVEESDADEYIESLTYALSHEPWPRYRHLLEWIVARIYSRFSGKTFRILEDLEKAAQYPPARIASLIKLGQLVAPFESERFAKQLLLQLVCFSASPKVQIRHEANFAFPVLFSLAGEKKWQGITAEATYAALDHYIRQMEKFHADPWTIRTLPLNAKEDYSLVDIFQGRYLTIESPEKERVIYEDFISLEAMDDAESIRCPPSRIPLGEKRPLFFDVQALETRPKQYSSNNDVFTVAPSFLQTKAFDFGSLYPPPDSPFTKYRRPASVILVASLIDNPTNLGGLSRISESFGLEALYIDDLKKTAHKDFKATSVTSEKHFPIHALKISDVPQFLIETKRKGYVVVGVEQTDRSGILGEGEDVDAHGGAASTRWGKSIGTLPKKCVVVLGSEKGGITPEVLTVIDRCVEIKTVGVTRSLNVQTAGGIALYEWWREWGGKS